VEHRSRNGGHTLCGVRAQRWPVEGTLWGGAGGQQGISRHCAKPHSASSTSARREPGLPNGAVPFSRGSISLEQSDQLLIELLRCDPNGIFLWIGVCRKRWFPLSTTINRTQKVVSKLFLESAPSSVKSLIIFANLLD